MKINSLQFMVPLAMVISLYQPLPVYAQSTYPSKTWAAYKDPAQAGWSLDSLEEAKKFAAGIGMATTMIVHKGVLVQGWGDLRRKYLVHSMRKSFLSALYGMSVRDKQIDLNSTLAQLSVDDSVHPLTAPEKEATVRDLLQSRSGVFLPAAYEGNVEKPLRGSHPHGTYWLYNNWDFNVLGTILEQKTHRRFFDDLLQRLAAPLGMEDVDTLDVFYNYELKKSQHPAYTFKMSTRDLARFGLLYCNNGLWKNKQLIPAGWVKESTTTYSSDNEGNGYGYMWWTADSAFKNRGMFQAAGFGGHHLFVFPKEELVIVLRVDTYAGKTVPLNPEFELVNRILRAKTGQAVAAPQTRSLQYEPRPTGQHMSAAEQQKYLGHYQFDGEWMEVIPAKYGIMMDTELMGKFYLRRINHSLFMLEDQQTYINFLFDGKGKAGSLIYHDKTITGVPVK